MGISNWALYLDLGRVVLRGTDLAMIKQNCYVGFGNIYCDVVWPLHSWNNREQLKCNLESFISLLFSYWREGNGFSSWCIQLHFV